jgi:regulator of protease activity HflC (stomatin/prohibitin superfamily)
MNPITLFLVAICVITGLATGQIMNSYLAFVFFAAALIIALSLKMANTWQKLVILIIGKLQSAKGAGLFLIIAVIDYIIAIIEESIQTTAFNVAQALTKDTVPVNVAAIIFGHVHDS